MVASGGDLWGERGEEVGLEDVDDRDVNQTEEPNEETRKTTTGLWSEPAHANAWARKRKPTRESIEMMLGSRRDEEDDAAGIGAHDYNDNDYGDDDEVSAEMLAELVENNSVFKRGGRKDKDVEAEEIGSTVTKEGQREETEYDTMGLGADEFMLAEERAAKRRQRDRCAYMHMYVSQWIERIVNVEDSSVHTRTHTHTH